MPQMKSDLNKLLSPDSTDERLCFLVGAGISNDLPETDDIIEALLTVITEPLTELLGEEKTRKIVRRMMRQQSLASGKVDFPVRLEYLLQLMKDYFDTSFSFMSRLFDIDHLPNTYHLTLSSLLQDSRNVVFTTNFDTQLERASHTRAVFRQVEFQRLSTCEDVAGIFKLHGSIEDPRTLGATFDLITERHHKNKRVVLQTGLKRRALCVIGYSGSDDTDVMPTLLNTPAIGQRVYWFCHDKKRKLAVYKLDRPDCIPEQIKQVHAYRLLKKMAVNGVRDPNELILIIGKTEPALKRFLGLRNLEFFEGPKQERPSKETTQGIVRDWFRTEVANKDRDILAMIVGTVLSYIVGVGGSPQQFARNLELLTANKPDWRVIALPKLAMAAIDVDRYAKAERYARAAIKAMEKSPENLQTVPKYLVAETRLDSHVWLSEALRMRGNPQKSLQVGLQGLQVEKPQNVGNKWRRLTRFRGDLYAAIAESHLVLGNLPEAEKMYVASMSHMERAAEWNWYWYARLGIADTLRAAGYLRIASEHYRQVAEGSYATGWRTWLSLQIRVSEFDVMRTQSRAINDAQLAELTWMADKQRNKYDDVIAFVAQTIKWDLDWMRDPSREDMIEEEYEDLLNKASGDQDARASLMLSHAEFLKHVYCLDQAQNDAEAVVEHAQTSGYRLLELHGRLVGEDIMRLKGKQVRWQRLAARYRDLGCTIGELYASVIGILSGARLSALATSHMNDFAFANGIKWASILLCGNGSRQHRISDTWLVFPGILTTV